MSDSGSTPPLTQEYLAQDRGYIVRDTAITFIVLIVVATALRTWSRYIQKTRLHWSDLFIILSLINILGTYTALLLGVRFGAGRHIAAVSPSDLVSFLKTIWFGIPICYIFCVIWPKLAILDLYLQIFINKYARWASYGCGGLIVVNALLFGSLTLGQCRPIQKTWNQELDGYCLNTTELFIWSTFVNMLTDFVMLIIPVPTILKLQRSWQTKLGVLMTFAVGGLGLAVSIVRFDRFYTSSIHPSNADATWNVITVFVWTIVEPGVYHLVACFLTYQSLFRWLAHKHYFSQGWSRVYSWISEKSGSRSSNSSDSVNAIADPHSTAHSGNSQRKRPDNHLDSSELDFDSGSVYGSKRGYVAKVEAQGDMGKELEAQNTHKEGNFDITVDKNFEVRSEKSSGTYHE